ncbi:MAG: LLM class flavin-dependent oxidoreductase [Thermomicrobiales bacterium]
MTHPRELSIAFQTDKQPDIYSDLAREVERYGFDALSMYSDLTYQPPIVPLTLAALATSTIRLGPASLNPFTLHPVEIAGQIATLDMVSKGRAYLGISRGAWLDAIDIEQERAIDRVVDTFGTVRHLLSRSGYEFRGKTFKMRPDVRLRYEPQRPDVPMMVGSWGPRLIKAASSLVDEIKLGGSANPDVVPVVREWIGSSADAADPAIVLGAVTIVDEDGDEARAAVKREMALYLPVVAPLDPTVAVDPALLENIERLVREGRVDDAGRQIPDSLVRRFAFAGTPGDVIEQCEAVFEAGAGRIEFGTPHGLSTASGIKLLGDVVLPSLANH